MGWGSEAGQAWAAAQLRFGVFGVRLPAGTQLASVPHTPRGAAGQQMLPIGLLLPGWPPAVPTFI